MAVSLTHQAGSGATGNAAVNPSQSTCQHGPKGEGLLCQQDDSCQRLSLLRSYIQRDLTPNGNRLSREPRLVVVE
jgi:hypothetical protein